MAWDFSAIRGALKTRLDAITNLTAYDTAPGQVNVPAAVVTPAQGQFIAYDSTTARQTDELFFVITLLVSKALDQHAQQNLDAYLDGTGSSSIKTAIEASRLGSGAEYQTVTEARNYGPIDYNGVTYLGCEFAVTVGAASF